MKIQNLWNDFMLLASVVGHKTKQRLGWGRPTRAEKSRERKELQYIFNERIANFVLLIVSQYYTQKLSENQAEKERDDWMRVSRKKFFDLQRDLREDKEITYFDSESKSATD